MKRGELTRVAKTLYFLPQFDDEVEHDGNDDRHYQSKQEGHDGHGETSGHQGSLSFSIIHGH